MTNWRHHTDLGEWFVSIMTDEIARETKKARVDYDCTWRSTAALMHKYLKERLPDSDDMKAWDGMPAMQLYGVDLCEVAAKFLGEDPYEKPWS